MKRDKGSNLGDHRCIVVKKLGRERLLKQVLSHLLKHERVGAV